MTDLKLPPADWWDVLGWLDWLLGPGWFDDLTREADTNRRRELADLSGAEHEEEFYTYWDCRPQPWLLYREARYTSGRYSLDSVYTTPEYFAWEKDGVVYTDYADAEPVDLDAVHRRLVDMQEALDAILGTEAPTWTVTIGDAEGHIIRSEN